MEHVVFFPAPDRSPAFRRFPDLDQALRFVEHLRNVENVTEASVYALTEVPLSFRAWYRVEVPSTHESNGFGPQIPSEPRTVAEAIEAMGSATGIVVPDEPLGVPPVAPVTPSPVAVAPPAATQPAVEPNQEIAPAENGRRGLGFFAR